MGIIFLTSEVIEAVRGQKHLSEALICMKESIYAKKCLMKVAQQPKKPLQQPPRSLYVHSY